MSPYPATSPISCGAIACRGFTLIELLVTISLIGLVATLAAPSLLGTLEKSRGKRCAANLLLLENAKDSFCLDHPGQDLNSTAQLLPYLRDGLPACPSGGSYSNLTERLKRCACSLDAQSGDKPNDGIHDLAR